MKVVCFRSLFTVLALLLALQVQGRAQEVASTQPAPRDEPAEVTQLLERVKAAYGAIRTLRMEATATADYDAAGRKQHYELKYTAALAAGGRFKHEVPGELIVAADGETTYVFLPATLRYYRWALGRSATRTATQPATRPTTRPALPGAARAALLDHNPSLLLALSDDAAEALRSWGPLEAGDDALSLKQQRADGSAWSLVFDDASGLLREVRIDESRLLSGAGVPGVATAVRRITYTASEANGEVPDEAVAFAPPAVAQEVEPAQLASASLAGEPAPELELPGMDGKSLALGALRGNVVLVDFWASWCEPCVRAAPHIKALAEENTQGFFVLAINLREDEPTVKQFIDEHGFESQRLRVLRDRNGAAAARWGVTGIPFSAVIGRDGKVREVIVGLQPEKLTSAVKAALEDEE